MSNPIVPQQYQRTKQLLRSDEIQARFREILADKAAGFLASVLNTVYNNDYLRDADPNSVITSALTAAALDLPVDPNLGFSYLIPYNERGVKIARFQMGYKGYVQLALRTGQYSCLNAAEIYEGEQVKVDRLTGAVLLNGQRSGDKVIGYVAYMRLINGFEKFVYMTTDEITRHAQKFSKSWNSKESVWKNNFDAMAKKTVLKALLSKYGILSIQMQRAIEADQGTGEVAEAQAVPLAEAMAERTEAEQPAEQQAGQMELPNG